MFYVKPHKTYLTMENSEVQVKDAIKVDPSNIMQIGMGFFASKTLLTAVKLELFTLLAVRPLTGRDIKLQIPALPVKLK